MNYYVYKESAKVGDKELKVLDHEPTEFEIGSLAVELGPIQILPDGVVEEIKKRSSEDVTREYIKAWLPNQVKVR